MTSYYAAAGAWPLASSSEFVFGSEPSVQICYITFNGNNDFVKHTM